MAGALAELRGSGTLRVVIADDHPAYRAGLSRMLRASGIEVVGEEPDGEAAVRLVEGTAPDVVILDLRMPGLSGLEVTRRLTEHAAPSPVLVLSVSAEQSDVTDAIAAGASGYVLKDEPFEEIIAALRAAAAGRPHISPQIANVLLGEIRNTIAAGDQLAGGGLSWRELELLELRAAGRDDREIGDALEIDSRAVPDYVRSILTKLQVEQRIREAGGGEP
jgi:DNA-binding NarL/FixJ family response regulator